MCADMNRVQFSRRMPLSLTCVARGTSVFDEAVPQLTDDAVQFVLSKFPVGSGTFQRTKVVYVHWIGPACSAVKRGKHNAEKDRALTALRVSAGVEVAGDRAELSFDKLVAKMRNVFVADDGTFDVSAIKKEYETRLAEQQAVMSPLKSDLADEPQSPIRPRKLATDLGASRDAILAALREDMGPFNWMTARPVGEAPLVEAGSNGLFELLDHLPDNAVLFGVVRVAFGSGRFRRTKRIFFQWNGGATGAVAKGKASNAKSVAMDALGPCNLDITLNGEDDRSVDGILKKLEHVFVVDNINLPSATPAAKAVSAEEYIKALEEEQRAASAFYDEPEDMPPSPKRGPVTFDVGETVDLVHQSEGGMSWAIFQFA